MHNEPLIAAQTFGRKNIRPEGAVGTAGGVIKGGLESENNQYSTGSCVAFEM